MYHIIVNPASRSGKGRKIWEEQVKPQLKMEKVEYTPHFTGESGHAAQIARELMAALAPGEKLSLILLGGDGTFDEVLQGINDFSRVVIGYIPTGSSNDFARDLKISTDPLEALDRILHTGKSVWMDLGEVFFSDGSSRRFATSLGIGFDAAVCEETNRSRMKEFLNKIGLGKLAYLGIALKQLIGAKSVSAELTVDGKVIRIPRFLFTCCMIHRYEGGGFMFAPKADPFDGKLDLCAVGNVPKPVILFALPTAFFGKHFWFKGVDSYRGSSVRIRTTKPLWTHTDGEIPGCFDDLRIECHRQVMEFRY